MTRYASPTVVRCPKCGDCVLRRRLASFNDFGAMRWTDGYVSILSLSAVSALARCPWCRAAFWIDDAAHLGERPQAPEPIGRIRRLLLRLTGDPQGELAHEQAWDAVPWEWKSAKPLDRPVVADWQAALQEAAALTPAREMLARRELWWRSNDPFRRNDEGQPWKAVDVISEGDRRSNLEALLRLGAATPEPNWVEQGELLRELGRFEEAIGAAERVTCHPRARQIAELARLGNPVVQQAWRSPFG